MTKFYKRLCRGVSDRGTLLLKEQIIDRVDYNNDWYESTFDYNEDQYKEFQKTKSIKGVDDVSTDSLYFDFDHKDQPELALQDTRELVKRLLPNMGQNQPEIYYSGQKGFHVIIQTDHRMSPAQVAQASIKLAEGLKTLDLTVYNASRILRVPGTLHQKSKLFKYPLTVKELNTLSVSNIKELAKSLDNTTSYSWGKYNLDNKLIELPKKPEKKEVNKQQSKLDMSGKP